jgi:hypothetical protein
VPRPRSEENEETKEMSDLKERLDRELATVVQTADARAAIDRRIVRRRRRRTVLLPTTTLILTAGLVAGLTYAFSSDPPTPPGEDRAIEMPGEPLEAMVDGDLLWVLTSEPGCDGPVCDGYVVRVDTSRGEVTARTPAVSPQGLASGAGSIWAVSFADATLMRLDPATGDVEATIPLTLPGEVPGSDWEFLPIDVDANEEGVWVSTARGAVAHVDPATDSVVEVVPLPPATVGGVAIGQESVWVGNSLGGVIRVDPQTHRVDAGVPIDDEVGRRLSVYSPFARDGSVWVVGGWGRRTEELDGVGYVATDRQALVEIEEGSGDIASIVDVREEAWLLGGADVWLVERDGTVLRRLDTLTGQLGESVPVPFGRPLAVAGTTAWSAVGESLRSWEVPIVSGDLDASDTEEPDTSRALCDFSSFRPTYLPWLSPRQPIPAPETARSADGGGPQGLDPGYSTLSWSNGDVTRPGTDREVGAVHLWRATQSVGSFPIDPDVPALPDGSTGRLYASEGGGGDWSIVWGDPTPDVTDDDCSETALVVHFPNLTKTEAKREVIRIAESLVTR